MKPGGPRTMRNHLSSCLGGGGGGCYLLNNKLIGFLAEMMRLCGKHEATAA